jgi:hypothetical protein
MPLDLSSIKKAIAALEYALTEAHNADFMNSLTPRQQEIIRAGVIQHAAQSFLSALEERND